MGMILCIIISVMGIVGVPQEETIGPVSLKFDADGSILNTDNVNRLSGWVEKLDENLRVTDVFGNKKTETMKYTMEDLLNLTSFVDSKEYYAYIQKNNGCRYISFYPKTSYNIIYSISYGLVLETPMGKAEWMFVIMILAADIIFICLYLSKNIKKPLNNLINDMRSVSGAKKFTGFSKDKRKFSGDREFVEIQEAFYEMVDSLKTQQEENETLRNNRNRMLLDLSHDIKTPVATIKSAALALKEGVVDSEKLSEYYEIIAVKADRVNSLSEDLFTMLKLESPDYMVELKKMDLAEFTRQISAGNYAYITEGGMNFEVDIPEEAVYVYGDGKLLTRVLENLFSNAKKYNLSGSFIRVSLVKSEGEAVISVEDDGEMISENVQNIMFHAFVRGESARTTKGGTGLGLSIAAAVMERHNGLLSYEYRNGKNVFLCKFR